MKRSLNVTGVDTSSGFRTLFMHNGDDIMLLMKIQRHLYFFNGKSFLTPFTIVARDSVQCNER